MSRALEIGDLPGHVQQRARAIAREQGVAANGIELGPDSPLRGSGRRRRSARPDPAEANAPRGNLEHVEQVKVIEWADDPETLARWPELDVLYAIPNESFGRRDGGEKKKRGRRKGMLDLCLPVPRVAPTRAVYGALYLEMKDEAGTVRGSQRTRMALLRERGNRCEVAMSADAAIAIIEQYLALPRP